MRRTQIYLDEDQKAALRALAADRGANVSDVIREAIDRLLRDEFSGDDWADRLRALQTRVQARLGDVSEEDVEAAFRRVREGRRKVTHG